MIFGILVTPGKGKRNVKIMGRFLLFIDFQFQFKKNRLV